MSVDTVTITSITAHRSVFDREGTLYASVNGPGFSSQFLLSKDATARIMQAIAAEVEAAVKEAQRLANKAPLDLLDNKALEHKA